MIKRKDAENQIEFYKTPEPPEEGEKFFVTPGEHFYYRPNPTGVFKVERTYTEEAA